MITLEVFMRHWVFQETCGHCGSVVRSATTLDPQTMARRIEKWGISLPTLPKKPGRYELHDGNWRRVGGGDGYPDGGGE